MLNEQIKKEVENSAQYLNMTVEEAIEKYTAICAENNTEAGDGLGLWRNYAAQNARREKQGEKTNTGSNSLTKQCFGFFV